MVASRSEVLLEVTEALVRAGCNRREKKLERKAKVGENAPSSQ